MKTITIHHSLLQAIGAGNKTQIRKPVFPQPPDWATDLQHTVGEWVTIEGVHPAGRCGHPTCACAGRDYDFPTAFDQPHPAMWTVKGEWQVGDIVAVNDTDLRIEITSVRVERLNSLRSYDAYWEGVEDCHELGHDDCFYGDHGRICSFEREWDKLHADCGLGWSSNPWVWVVGFKVVEES